MAVLQICRCCLERATDKSLKEPYKHRGETEIYSLMLKNCFDIHLTIDNEECGICLVCVGRLRDASDFKLQVQRCQLELQIRLELALQNIEEDDVKTEPSGDEGIQDDCQLQHTGLKPALSTEDPAKPETVEDGTREDLLVPGHASLIDLTEEPDAKSESAVDDGAQDSLPASLELPLPDITKEPGTKSESAVDDGAQDSPPASLELPLTDINVQPPVMSGIESIQVTNADEVPPVKLEVEIAADDKPWNDAYVDLSQLLCTEPIAEDEVPPVKLEVEIAADDKPWNDAYVDLSQLLCTEPSAEDVQPPVMSGIESIQVTNAEKNLPRPTPRGRVMAATRVYIKTQKSEGKVPGRSKKVRASTPRVYKPRKVKGLGAQTPKESQRLTLQKSPKPDSEKTEDTKANAGAETSEGAQRQALKEIQKPTSGNTEVAETHTDEKSAARSEAADDEKTRSGPGQGHRNNTSLEPNLLRARVYLPRVVFVPRPRVFAAAPYQKVPADMLPTRLPEIGTNAVTQELGASSLNASAWQYNEETLPVSLAPCQREPGEHVKSEAANVRETRGSLLRQCELGKTGQIQTPVAETETAASKTRDSSAQHTERIQTPVADTESAGFETRDSSARRPQHTESSADGLIEMSELKAWGSFSVQLPHVPNAARDEPPAECVASPPAQPRVPGSDTDKDNDPPVEMELDVANEITVGQEEPSDEPETVPLNEDAVKLEEPPIEISDDEETKEDAGHINEPPTFEISDNEDAEDTGTHEVPEESPVKSEVDDEIIEEVYSSQPGGSLSEQLLVSVRLERLRDDSNTCHICRRTFDRAFTLAKHMTTHGHTADDLAVDLDDDTPQESSPTHMKKAKNSTEKRPTTHEKENKVPPEQAFICDICHRKYPSKHSIYAHIKTHLNAKSFPCKYCSKVFARKTAYTQHVKSHTNVKQLHFCDVCNKAFKKRNNLNTHKRIHLAEKPYVCEICDREFTRNDRYTEHILTHSGRKPYKCDHCDKQFSVRHSLRTHNRYVHSKKRFKCDTCGKEFSTRTMVNRHIRIHTGQKDYVCDHCKKRYSDKSRLARHMRVHLGIRPFECATCQRRFKRKSFLKTHQLVHSTEKPYTCDYCKKSYNRRETLRLHITMHMGTEPHSCDICTRKFTTTSMLARHKNMHAGVKPHKCEWCEKRFLVKSTLVAHRRTHTGERPFKCELCGKSFAYKLSLVKHSQLTSCDARPGRRRVKKK